MSPARFAAGGISCTGDWSSGANESFEKADSQFCTTDWVITDTQNKLEEYSTTDYFMGTHCLEITCHSGTSADCYITGTHGDDTNYFYRFYLLNTPALASGGNTYPSIVYASNGTSLVVLVSYYDVSGAKRFRLGNGSTFSTNYFAVDQAHDYRLDVHVIGTAGACSLKVYNHTDDEVVLNNGGVNDFITYTGGNFTPNMVRFADYYNNAANILLYIDDIEIGLSATDYIGEEQ
jgi:hypothetical protein